MKTLVIHPADATTAFLRPIYSGQEWTVVQQHPGNSQLRRLIQDHDRIVMLGHGTPQGLIGHGGFIINSTHVQLLREKDTVCIWCNADQFVEGYGLKGFYTGMIISEEHEATYCGVFAQQQDVEQSNLLFTEAVKQGIAGNKNWMHRRVKNLYFDSLNPIIKYNQENIYKR